MNTVSSVFLSAPQRPQRLLNHCFYPFYTGWETAHGPAGVFDSSFGCGSGRAQVFVVLVKSYASFPADPRHGRRGQGQAQQFALGLDLRGLGGLDGTGLVKRVQRQEVLAGERDELRVGEFPAAKLQLELDFFGRVRIADSHANGARP